MGSPRAWEYLMEVMLAEDRLPSAVLSNSFPTLDVGVPITIFHNNNTICRCFTRIQLRRGELPTFVPPHPSRNAASCAKSSPNPNMSPLINGRSKLMAAPRRSPQSVGGLYSIIGGELEEEGGEGD